MVCDRPRDRPKRLQSAISAKLRLQITPQANGADLSDQAYAGVSSSGAAQESNLPSLGLPDLTGFEASACWSSRLEKAGLTASTPTSPAGAAPTRPTKERQRIAGDLSGVQAKLNAFQARLLVEDRFVGERYAALTEVVIAPAQPEGFRAGVELIGHYSNREHV